jgi:poly(3-hydroxybutyrate) depolymerase
VSDCGAEQLTPVLAVHGDADPLAPYDGGDVFGFPLDLPAAEVQLTELAVLGGCGADPEVETLGEDVEHRTWTGCDGEADVELYTVLGGAHTWPGSELLGQVAAAEPSPDDDPAGQALAAESALGFDLDQILGDPTETIDATMLALDFFDRHGG